MGKTAENTKKKSGSDGEIFRVIVKAGDGIKNFSDKIEKISGKAPEIIAMLAYTVGHFLMMLAHEPWFDEALAWLIAKDSTVWEILFEAPHYEGHPGLWHLVLMPFAKCGAPYELSLSVISFVFSGAAIALLLWKAPFKRIIRLLMPFTYFLFYQYSVVSRPYCMMMLAFALIAMLYNSRNEKPGRFILSLAFLCATSAYGVVIAGGLCIAWLIQLLLEAKKEGTAVVKGFFKKLSEHGKVWYLAGLLGYACFIIIRLVPTEKTYASIRAEVSATGGIKTHLMHLLYTMFGALPDTVLTNTYSDLNILSNAGFSKTELFTAALLGLLILAAIFAYGKKKKEVLSFYIPYVMLAVFSAVVYIFTFHIGIFLLFTVMWLWICTEKKISADVKEKRVEGTENSTVSLKDAVMSLVPIFTVIIMVISVMWTVTSCIADVDSEYGFGRNESNYLKENGLDGCSILCDWNPVFQADMAKEGYDEFDVAFSYSDVCAAPYLKNTEFLNHMDELNLKYTFIHRTNNSEENAEIIRKIAEKGEPEVLLGLVDLAVFFDLEDVNITDYTKVFQNRYGTVWKGAKGLNSSSIYVRNDIAEKKGLKGIAIKPAG